MNIKDKKDELCAKHHTLLHLVWRFGAGAMLQPQLRALCLRLGVYSSRYATDQAVRDLKAAGLLRRQRWLDNNSDLLLLGKGALAHLRGEASRQIAGLPKRNTYLAYLSTVCKVDTLLVWLERFGVDSLDEAEAMLGRLGTSVFCRLPDLADYFAGLAPLCTDRRRFEVHLSAMERAQAERFGTEHQGPKVKTLETLYRKGIYVLEQRGQGPSARLIFAIYDYTGHLTAETLSTKVLDVAEVCVDLGIKHWGVLVQTLDQAKAKALHGALGKADYFNQRCAIAHITPPPLKVHNADISAKWCHGIRIV